MLGFANSIVLGIIASIASSLSLSRICAASSDSIYSVYLVGRNISNFIGYFVTGCTSLFMFMLILFSQEENMNADDLRELGLIILSFSFGSSTVAIGTKINAIIYSKGA